MWSVSQMSNSPSTTVDEIVLALRKAADDLESQKDYFPDAFKKLVR